MCKLRLEDRTGIIQVKKKSPGEKGKDVTTIVFWICKATDVLENCNQLKMPKIYITYWWISVSRLKKLSGIKSWLHSLYALLRIWVAYGLFIFRKIKPEMFKHVSQFLEQCHLKLLFHRHPLLNLTIHVVCASTYNTQSYHMLLDSCAITLVCDVTLFCLVEFYLFNKVQDQYQFPYDNISLGYIIMFLSYWYYNIHHSMIFTDVYVSSTEYECRNNIRMLSYSHFLSQYLA